MFALSYAALIYPQLGGERCGQYRINKGRKYYCLSLHGGLPSLGKTQMYKKLSHLKLKIIKKMLFNYKIISIKQRPYLKNS